MSLLIFLQGLYISGIIGDRFELRKVLSLGMCLTGIIVWVFGCVLEWSHYYNRYLYVGVWIVNGLLQSSGWPTVVALMGNWFGKSSRGFVFGLWSACASVGNIIGALMVSQVLHYGYDFAFLLTSTVLFAGGILNFFAIIDSPNQVGLPSPDNEISEDEVQVNVQTLPRDIPPAADIQVHSQVASDEEEDEDSAPLLGSSHGHTSVPQHTEKKSDQALSFWHALLLPGVIMYSLSYFCLKLVNYSFFFWLPYYLHGSFGWDESTADKISIWYDIGGIIGGTIAGVISDMIGKRSIVVMPMLLLSIPSLLIYSNSPNDMTINAVLMTIAGLFIGGVANLISAAISADLGKQGPVQGNKEALATVTGIVDGTGSVGAALGQILVPLLQEGTGWHSVFYLFIIMTILTAVCILPLFLREMMMYPWVRNCCGRYTYSWYGGVQRKDLSLNRGEDGHVSSNDSE